MIGIDRIIADTEIGDDFEIGQCVDHGRIDAAEGGDAAHGLAHFIRHQGRIGALDPHALERLVDPSDRMVVEMPRHQYGDREVCFGFCH